MIDVGIIGASGYTGAELLRLCAAPSRARGACSPPATPRRAPPSPSSTRAWPPPTRASCSTAYDPAPARPGSTWCSAACPTAPARRIVPELRRTRCGRVVDLAADFRLQDAGALPAVVRRGARRPRAARPASPTACPSSSGTRSPAPPPWPPPAATRRPPSLALAPLVRAGLVETTGIVVDAASRRVGRRPAARSPTPRSARSTRTSPPTACSTHRHTPEIEQTLATSAGARSRCCSRRTWRR